MSTITSTVITSRRNGVMWELRHPGRDHYSVWWPDGRFCLHSSETCSNMTNPFTVSRKIVSVLWREDVVTGAANGENDVEWCMTCAVKRVS